MIRRQRPRAVLAIRVPRRSSPADTSSSSSSIFATSCEVRKPSKKCRNGIRDSSVGGLRDQREVLRFLHRFAEQSIAQPVARAAITSLWSPKIDSACAATERAAT